MNVANAMVPASLTVGTQTRSATMIEAATEDARMTDGVMTSATIAEATSSEAAFAYATMHDASVLDQTMTEEERRNKITSRSPRVSEAMASTVITHLRGDSWRNGTSGESD